MSKVVTLFRKRASQGKAEERLEIALAGRAANRLCLMMRRARAFASPLPLPGPCSIVNNNSFQLQPLLSSCTSSVLSHYLPSFVPLLPSPSGGRVSACFFCRSSDPRNLEYRHHHWVLLQDASLPLISSASNTDAIPGPATPLFAMNATTMAASGALPPLPAYTLQPLEPLIPPIADKYMTLIFPILAYWGLSMIFHMIDVYDLFPQYRLHTPAEVLKRNHVSRWEVVRDVVIQQVVQTLVGMAIAWNEEDQMTGKDDYNVAVWAQRLRLGQQYVPAALALVGLDGKKLAGKIMNDVPDVAGFLAGGQYPWLAEVVNDTIVPRFAVWELLLAKFIYWVGVPALQFGFAILVVDTWQYFLHRAMHMNKWLYSMLSMFSSSLQDLLAYHTLQPLFTLATTVFTSPTLMAHFIIIPLRAFFSTLSVPALPTCSLV